MTRNIHLTPDAAALEAANLKRKLTDLERIVRRLGASTGGGAAAATVVTVNLSTTLPADTPVLALAYGTPVVSMPAVHAPGLVHEVKDAGGTAGTAPINVDGNGSLIDGEPSVSLNTDRHAIRLVSDGTDWHLF